MTNALWEGPNRLTSVADRRSQVAAVKHHRLAVDGTSVHENSVFPLQVHENSVFSLQVTAVANRRSVPIAAAALSVRSTCTRSKPEQYAEVNKTITMLCRQIEYLHAVLYLHNASALCC